MRVRAGSENGGADERASEWGAKASASRGVEAAAAKPRAAAASLEFGVVFAHDLKPTCQFYLGTGKSHSNITAREAPRRGRAGSRSPARWTKCGRECATGGLSDARGTRGTLRPRPPTRAGRTHLPRARARTTTTSTKPPPTRTTRRSAAWRRTDALCARRCSACGASTATARRRRAQSARNGSSSSASSRACARTRRPPDPRGLPPPPRRWTRRARKCARRSRRWTPPRASGMRLRVRSRRSSACCKWSE